MSHTIVGIMPVGFAFPAALDLWVPQAVHIGIYVRLGRGEAVMPVGDPEAVVPQGSIIGRHYRRAFKDAIRNILIRAPIRIAPAFVRAFCYSLFLRNSVPARGEFDSE